MMVQLGALVGKTEKTLDLVESIQQEIELTKIATRHWKVKPKVYFEEWYDPLISGIQWVSEIIEIAGGIDVFSEFQQKALAKDRIIADHQIVVEKNPDIILASWCGKMFKKPKLIAREGWSNINAVKNNAIYEIKSELILQPGPAALMEALPQIHQIFKEWKESCA